jgi:acyl-CoA thioester hydrolase
VLDGFPIVVEVPVRWGDMDAYGHVNNSVYLTYFESARIAYFHALALPGWVTPGGAGPIVHSTKCRYRIPVTYPDTLTVGARVDAAGIAEDRFNMILTAWSARHKAAAADGECLVVVFDYAAGKKAKVTPELREAIARVEAKRAA